MILKGRISLSQGVIVNININMSTCIAHYPNALGAGTGYSNWLVFVILSYRAGRQIKGPEKTNTNNIPIRKKGAKTHAK